MKKTIAKIVLLISAIVIISIKSSAQVTSKVLETNTSTHSVFKFQPWDIADILIHKENSQYYEYLYWPKGGVRLRSEVELVFGKQIQYIEDAVSGEQTPCESYTPRYQFNGLSEEFDSLGNLISSKYYRNYHLKKNLRNGSKLNDLQSEILPDSIIYEDKTYNHIIYRYKDKVILDGFWNFEDYTMKFIENCSDSTHQKKSIDFFVFDTYHPLVLDTDLCCATDSPEESGHKTIMTCDFDCRNQLYRVSHKLVQSNSLANDEKTINENIFWVNIQGRILNFQNDIRCADCFFGYEPQNDTD